MTDPRAVLPVPSTAGIPDRQTKEVLDALVNEYLVRNGQIGNRREQFITRADLEAVFDNAQQAIEAGAARPPSTRNGGGYGGPGTEFPDLTGVIDSLRRQILNSELFQYLGQGVDLIYKPEVGLFARTERSETAILDEVTARQNADEANLQVIQGYGARIENAEAALINQFEFSANEDNALATGIMTMYAEVDGNISLIQQEQQTLANDFAVQAEQVTTLQARLDNAGGDTVSLEEQMEVLATADGELKAQYTVKIDNQGFVSGYGLASTANNSDPRSEFYVRADTFAVGSPGVPRPIEGYDAAGNPIYGPLPDTYIPFTVKTTYWTDDNGIEQPPGVYIRQGALEWAWIQTAHIKDLLVEAAWVKEQNIWTRHHGYQQLRIAEGSEKAASQQVESCLRAAHEAGFAYVANLGTSFLPLLVTNRVEYAWRPGYLQWLKMYNIGWYGSQGAHEPLLTHDVDSTGAPVNVFVGGTAVLGEAYRFEDNYAEDPRPHNGVNEMSLIVTRRDSDAAGAPRAVVYGPASVAMTPPNIAFGFGAPSQYGHVYAPGLDAFEIPWSIQFQDTPLEGPHWYEVWLLTSTDSWTDLSGGVSAVRDLHVFSDESLDANPEKDPNLPPPPYGEIE